MYKEPRSTKSCGIKYWLSCERTFCGWEGEQWLPRCDVLIGICTSERHAPNPTKEMMPPALGSQAQTEYTLHFISISSCLKEDKSGGQVHNKTIWCLIWWFQNLRKLRNRNHPQTRLCYVWFKQTLYGFLSHYLSWFWWLLCSYEFNVCLSLPALPSSSISKSHILPCLSYKNID